MSGLSDVIRAELAISDPWEIAAAFPAPMRGKVTEFTNNSVVLLFDQPVAVGGVVVRGAVIAPRHTPDWFDSSGRPVAANIVLTADLPSALVQLKQTAQPKETTAASIAVIGTVSIHSAGGS